MIKAQIKDRNQIAFALLKLRCDKHFPKIPEEKRVNLIQEAIAVGNQAARELRDEFGITDPFELAKKFGIKIIECGSGVFGKLIKKSEYRPGSRTIAIYEKNEGGLRIKISKKETWVNESQISKIARHKLLVAHELFHYLELNGLGKVSQRFRIERFSFGRFHFYRELGSLSEIAAQAFAGTLLNLNYPPVL